MPLFDFGMSKAAGKGWLEIPGLFLPPAAQNEHGAVWREKGQLYIGARQSF
jgi:hypothetical protein